MMAKIAVITFLFTYTVCVLGEFNLTVVHISDFHSHWFEFDENKHDCSREESKAGKCYGGFARLLTFVRDIRKTEKNVLVLSSGEFFLGKSLYSLHGWRMAHSLLPKLELDAMSLSNHDFDSGVFEFSVFSYAMKFPILCANMIARNTSFIYSRVNKSVVLDVNGSKVGIIGYIHRHAQKKTRRAVSFKFIPEIPALQEEVSRLENEGVNKVIALGHAGYHTDIEIAKNVKGVDIVMGGDSDIMLFDPGHDADEISKIGNIHGNYPRIHHQEPESADDPSLVNRTLVLHIPQHGMYVGVLRVSFDDDGKIIHESGEPVLLDNSIPQDKATLEFLEWATGALEELNEHGRLPDDAEILGVAKGHFDGNRRRCRMQECALGNFIADAMLHEFTFHYRNKSEHRYHVEQWGPIDAVVFNSGTILRSIEPGFIKIKDLVKSIFLGGFVRRSYMSGQQVLDMMEHSVKHYDPSGVTAPGSFLQIAGMKVEYDLSLPPGRRVRNLMMRCRDCGDDNMYHPIVSYKTYVIGMPFFIHDGRDGFYDFDDPSPKDMGQFDVLLLIEHLRRVYEVMPKLDGRIKFFQLHSLANSSYSPPLHFGEPASEYNKFDGIFALPPNVEVSETDKNEEKNIIFPDGIAEKENDKENKNTNSSIKKQLEEKTKINNDDLMEELSSYENIDLKKQGEWINVKEYESSSTSSVKRQLVEETKVNTDGLMQESPNYKNVNLKEKGDALGITKIHTRYPNQKGTNGHDLVTEMKNNEPDKKDSLKEEYLSEISSNLLEDFVGNMSSNLTKRSIKDWLDGNSKSFFKIKNNISSFFENLDKCLRSNLSNNNSDSDEILRNSTKNLIISKRMKVLLNDFEILNSFENISEIFKSYLLETILRNWLADNRNIKNNATNFFRNLDKCLKRNISINDTDSNETTTEMTTNVTTKMTTADSSESGIKKTLVEIVKHVLRINAIVDIFKNMTGIEDIMNTTTSNATDMG